MPGNYIALFRVLHLTSNIASLSIPISPKGTSTLALCNCLHLRRPMASAMSPNPFEVLTSHCSILRIPEQITRVNCHGKLRIMKTLRHPQTPHLNDVPHL